jgi:cleavage and polyadenylation specificity factor subunit 3
MTRLKSKLMSLNAHKSVPAKIYSPANCEELRIPFKTDKIAKVVGKLASIPPPLPHTDANGEGEDSGKVAEQPSVFTGVLIQNDFKISLMAPEDLKEYAGLTTTTVVCRQHLKLSAAGIDLIRWALEGTFGAITETSKTDTAIDGMKSAVVAGNGASLKLEYSDEEIDRSSKTFRVMDCVDVICWPGGSVDVEWEGNMINDGIADAVLAVLFTVESSPAAVRRECSLLYPSSSLAHRLIFHKGPCILCNFQSFVRITQLTTHPESSRSHSHSHSHTPIDTGAEKTSAQITHRFKQPNPHKTADPETRFARLCLFLEAQFGEDAVHPIHYPRNSSQLSPMPGAAATPNSNANVNANANTGGNEKATVSTANGTEPAASKMEDVKTDTNSNANGEGNTDTDTKPYTVAALPSSNTTSPTSPTSSTSPSPSPNSNLPNLSPTDAAELSRLHKLGLPVPGIEIKFDKYIARVWLEDLDVECASKPLKGRVKAVVERGVETVSGLWV